MTQLWLGVRSLWSAGHGSPRGRFTVEVVAGFTRSQSDVVPSHSIREGTEPCIGWRNDLAKPVRPVLG